MAHDSRWTDQTDPRELPRVVRGVRQSPARGRRRMDRSHDLFQDQMGCLMMLMTAAPALHWIWHAVKNAG